MTTSSAAHLLRGRRLALSTCLLVLLPALGLAAPSGEEGETGEALVPFATSEDCALQGTCVGNYFMPAVCGADHYCLTTLDIDKVVDCTKEGKLCSEEHKQCMDPADLNIRIDLNVITLVRDEYRKGSEVELVVDVVDATISHVPVTSSTR